MSLLGIYRKERYYILCMEFGHIGQMKEVGTSTRLKGKNNISFNYNRFRRMFLDLLELLDEFR
jgi:hypothetical protein